MSSNNSLGGIPITIQPIKASSRLHWQRRAVQIATIVIAVIIPLSGLFRIDPVAGAFVIIDRQIWWSDFFLVFGLWLVIASGLVMLYSTVGTAFCGWSCPQNSLSEWANYLTRRLLGKRADVSLTGEKVQVGANKNKWLNWLLLGAGFLVAALFFALVPLFYFYSPSVIWSFVTFQYNEQLAGSLHYIYFIFVLIVFIDIAFIRHFWCRFMCIYKVWQHGFKTKQTLHIDYDSSQAELCEKCNYCVTSCFLELDPRKTELYDTCINCGECITACDQLQAKKGRQGLLRFNVGERFVNKKNLLRTRLSSLSSRVHWTLPFAALGVAMFVWGLVSYEYYHLVVYRADISHGQQITDYRIVVSNKRNGAAEVAIEIEGLSAEQYHVSSTTARFAGVGRMDLDLKISPDMPPGLHSFLVHARAPNGWAERFRVQHFVGKSSAGQS
ncbi:MAG: 4Fe-4S binding protein [Gammaproteobacteria bacterium]|nr:4Fe-4S binding protein [Gammaproteobacteria bacterium]